MARSFTPYNPDQREREQLTKRLAALEKKLDPYGQITRDYHDQIITLEQALNKKIIDLEDAKGLAALANQTKEEKKARFKERIENQLNEGEKEFKTGLSKEGGFILFMEVLGFLVFVFVVYPVLF